MFWYMCTIFRENTMPVLKTKCYCKAAICVLPADGIHVLKHVGDAHLVLVLIKKVHLVGIINGVCSIYAGFHKKNLRNFLKKCQLSSISASTVMFLFFVLTWTYFNKKYTSESEFYPTYLQVFGCGVR